MINWDKINKKISVNKIILPFFVVILILLLIMYGLILKRYIHKSIYAAKLEQTIAKNQNPCFSIERIYICNSANAIDSTEEQKLDKLDLYQYSDIAIYINNHSEEGLTNQNTIKELYIDNIDLELDYNIGKTGLTYTNLLKIGSKEELKNIVLKNMSLNNSRIDFNILSTNEENSQADYENPTFYADCSNPISLKYINQLNREYSIGKDNTATFDGSILQKAGVKPEDIGVKIKFQINLVNNEGEYYTNLVNFKLPLDDIYKGTTIRSKKTEGIEYNFVTI